ncbi:MAG: hypothetical protein HZA18_08365 [Nitrospirae bacterium]|nr:hypothetical protein [Nitrospirota bacterium]
MAKSKSGYSGIAELIKDFVVSAPANKHTLTHLTEKVFNEYPDSSWENTWKQWRYHVLHPNGDYSDSFTGKEKERLHTIFETDGEADDVVGIDSKLLEFCGRLIKAALEYEKLFGKKLNVTGEIGEILVSHKLGLKMVMQGDATYDAIDKDGKRVQIKCRRSEKDNFVNKSGRISSISHSFDYMLFGMLDRNYELYEIWKTPYGSKLKKIIENEQTERSGPSINSILKVSERLF